MNKRLLSLDVFSGATIAGMILVNNPGSWSDPLLYFVAWFMCRRKCFVRF